MNKVKPIKRALLSVSDKQGIVAFAQSLARYDIEIISTGGTAQILKEADVVCRDIAEMTQWPEMMDGRVKTLHPAVHGGLLAKRDDAAHIKDMETHNIAAIDLLVVNLYPFEETLDTGGDVASHIEMIDIGGPAMIRAAAKNHSDVAVVVEGDDYAAILAALEQGGTDLALRQRLAQKAFARVAAYDATISNWMATILQTLQAGQAGQTGQTDSPSSPSWYALGGKRKASLRYGENPHQQAGFYITPPTQDGLASARQVQGKALSYNNINDADAALALVSEFDPQTHAAVAIIKHANPCGVACGGDLATAFARARACDPVSAFGGIIALNRPLDKDTATAISDIFTEVIIAPDADGEAQDIIARKKNLRLLLTGARGDIYRPRRHIRSVAGGFLLQDHDIGHIDAADLACVSRRAPTPQELADLQFAWVVAKHVKSNAIIYAKDGATVGIGAGQMSRLDSATIAAHKAQDAARLADNKTDAPLTQGSVVASDAFFPFADGLLATAQAGATAIIQPGGSVRDDEIIAAADDAGLAMLFTGMRHFRH